MQTAFRSTAWFPVLPSLAPRVSGPGDEWMQAPTEQEKKLGYKKTDVMTLQLHVGELRAKVDELVGQVDVEQTDPASLQQLKTLQSNVAALDTAVAQLAQGLRWDYPILLIKYNGLAAEFASFGVQEAAPPPTPGKSPGSPPVVKPPTPVKPAAPGAPTITKKADGGLDWLLGVSGLFLVAGLAYGAKLAGYW